MIHYQHNFVILGFFFNKRSVIQVLIKPTFEKPAFNQLPSFLLFYAKNVFVEMLCVTTFCSSFIKFSFSSGAFL